MSKGLYMRDIKEDLKKHIRNSSTKQIYEELVDAGLYTYATTENIINR